MIDLSWDGLAPFIVAAARGTQHKVSASLVFAAGMSIVRQIGAPETGARNGLSLLLLLHTL